MAVMLTGMGVSRGVSIGPVYVLRRDQPEIVERTIEKKHIAGEIRRFKAAHTRARKELLKVKEGIPQDSPEDISAFIETHLLMLDDSMLANTPIEVIKQQHCNAEWALKTQRDAIVKVFESMDDPYIATRSDDVHHVFNRVMQALIRGKKRDEEEIQNWKDHIIVADDLTPADTVLMQNNGVAGFVTEMGGPLSHTAILARSLNIPAVVGLSDARRYLKPGEPLVLDGSNGMVLADTEDDVIDYFKKRQRELKRKARELVKLTDARSRAKSGEKITLLANIEIEDDLKALKKVNAAGVGLYRTEFLYMSRDDIPDEEEHYKTYMRVVRALRGAPLTIRTVDLGADKEVETIVTGGPLAHNPAMGLRGIRLCLNDPAIIVPQLRAILRASAKAPIKIMFPMLTTVSELLQAIQLLESTKETMRSEGIRFDEKIQVGGMIEVPAAAISAAHFAKHLDFLSIGTNDLIQYTLAIDRIDDQVNYLYDPLNPAVLTLIKTIIDAGNKQKIPVTMCGEMAGNTEYTRLLLGLGLREFSMPPNSVLEIKNVLRSTNVGAIRRKALAFLNISDQEKQGELLARLNE
ncbi:MAG: phosphoenolpyruvate--protein phosphotransferase [Pseudomonadota bacterium]